MKAFAVVLAWAALSATTVPPAQAADIPGWFNASASNDANATAAVRAKDTAGNAASTLVRLGSDPVDSVRAVVKAYNTCPALYDAVREGSKASPSRAGEIAAGVAKLDTCPCSGENVWARSRLSQRLRTQRQTPAPANVALGFSCTCTAATAEAAATAAPDQGEAILRALTSGGSCGCAASSFAGIANTLGPGPASRTWIESMRKKAEQTGAAGAAGAAPTATATSAANAPAETPAATAAAATPPPAAATLPTARSTLGADAGLACPTEIAALATQFPEAPIPLAPPTVATADGAPQSDDSVIDPNRGGELASPN